MFTWCSGGMNYFFAVLLGFEETRRWQRRDEKKGKENVKQVVGEKYESDHYVANSLYTDLYNNDAWRDILVLIKERAFWSIKSYWQIRLPRNLSLYFSFNGY